MSQVRAARGHKDEDAYERAFRDEVPRSYPTVDRFVERAGHDLDGARLLAAARVLACPVKAHPPCWQHGRVVYAAVRGLARELGRPLQVLDVGTAKGFSALCAAWALADAAMGGRVTSVDVVHPDARVARNSVADVLPGGPPSVSELLAPFWPRGVECVLLAGGSEEFFLGNQGYRPDFAFLDGKHDHGHVSAELSQLAARQSTGDLVLADDTQVLGVAQAVREAERDGDYGDVRWIGVLPHRGYALMRKT